MSTQPININDLAGADLDYQVAILQGMEPEIENHKTFSRCYVRSVRLNGHGKKEITFSPYSPSWNLYQGGSIIEKEKIGVEFDGEVWVAFKQPSAELPRYQAEGNTFLEAAMRCFVMSRLGLSW